MIFCMNWEFIVFSYLYVVNLIVIIDKKETWIKIN